jgi:hypothetical protein
VGALSLLLPPFSEHSVVSTSSSESQGRVTAVTVAPGAICDHSIRGCFAGKGISPAGENTLTQIIQVELRTDTTHTVTWLDAALNPKPGMALVCKGDSRPWVVVHAYGIAPRDVNDSNAGWKVGVPQSADVSVQVRGRRSLN